MELNKNTEELLDKYIDTLDIMTSKETAIRNLLLKALSPSLEDRIKQLEEDIENIKDRVYRRY